MNRFELSVNGETRAAAAGETLVDLLRALGLDEQAVAVEKNGEIVRRAQYAAALLAPGDRVEIVRFVQGG